MSTRTYKPSTASRVRAFFLTDRVGQTLAATLSLVGIARWWLAKQLGRGRAAAR